MISITGLSISLAPLILRNENISLLISLIYVLPLFIFSIIAIILFTKFIRSKKLDIKLFLSYNNFINLVVWGICFSGTYMIQFILFNNWTSIDYFKIIILFILLIIPISIISIRNAPKKFINQFSKDNIYKNQSKAATGITIALIGLANLTKPYMLMLLLLYGCVLYLTTLFIFLFYKAKKYEYIQSLSKFKE